MQKSLMVVAQNGSLKLKNLKNLKPLQQLTNPKQGEILPKMKRFGQQLKLKQKQLKYAIGGAGGNGPDPNEIYNNVKNFINKKIKQSPISKSNINNNLETLKKNLKVYTKRVSNTYGQYFKENDFYKNISNFFKK